MLTQIARPYASALFDIARDGNARRTRVTVGLVSAGKAEILSGVQAGEMLVPQSAGPIRDGRRVRLRTAEPATP